MIKTDGAVVCLRSDKEKDEEAFEEVAFLKEKVGVGVDARGQQMTSLVLIPTEGKCQEATHRTQAHALIPSERTVLAALTTIADGPVSKAEWRTAVKEKQPSLSDRTFERWVNRLTAKGGAVVKVARGLYQLAPGVPATATEPTVVERAPAA